MRRVCVFCGSRPGRKPEYVEAARRLAALLAELGIGVVYGAANVGVMGALAEAALQQGSEVIGVIPRHLMARERYHKHLSKLHVVDTMHERKAVMGSLSDGFVALPGGLGTLEEFFEVLTWNQLGIHAKPCGLLNVAGFYDGLAGLLDRAVNEAFVPEAHRRFLVIERDPGVLLDRMQQRYTRMTDSREQVG